MSKNDSADDIQVNIRFNQKDYQKLKHRYRRHIYITSKEKIPSLQAWIRETLLA